MFEHSLSGKCQYGDRCTKKLFNFRHKKQIDSEDEQEKDVEEIKKVCQMFRDDDIKLCEFTMVSQPIRLIFVGCFVFHFIF